VALRKGDGQVHAPTALPTTAIQRVADWSDCGCDGEENTFFPRRESNPGRSAHTQAL